MSFLVILVPFWCNFDTLGPLGTLQGGPGVKRCVSDVILELILTPFGSHLGTFLATQMDANVNCIFDHMLESIWEAFGAHLECFLTP